jgi:hypothetical protein
MKKYPRLIAALKSIIKQHDQDASTDKAYSVEQLMLGENDLSLRWKVELVTSDGKKSVLDGRVNMPEIFAPHMLPESVRNFEATVAALFMRPVFAKFQSLCNTRAMSQTMPTTPMLALPESVENSGGDTRL